MSLPIAFAADHAGFSLKDMLAEEARAAGHQVLDLGTHGPDSVDYPDYAHALAGALERGEAALGVLVCGTGIGMAIAANRHSHIRAAQCAEGFSARSARAHNDANVLVLGARAIGVEVARDALRAFLETPYAGGRHAVRVAKLNPVC